MPHVDATQTPSACRLLLGGQVQGVGFRPFVYRTAKKTGIQGWVQNCRGEVLIHAEGEAQAIEQFTHRLLQQAPAIARPVLINQSQAGSEEVDGFVIRQSDLTIAADIHTPVDYFTCPDCLEEMNDPHDRRYRYPFINCTQCGPRYTLILTLPYDRVNTSMAGFELCPACEKEYSDPEDRRFHAQPIACPECGPQLYFVENGQTIQGNEAALEKTLGVLRRGGIVAIKGVGGYHLMCDARSDRAVQALRQRKRRLDKPFAVMFPVCGDDELDAVREHADMDESALSLLRSPQRPIVLLTKAPSATRQSETLSAHIAPGVNELGVFLPYSPLHYLLLQEFNAPLVATSANLSGEPVMTDSREVEQRLVQVADAFLHHDRPIVHSADDSVYRVIHHRARPLRPGRGMAPLELTLPVSIPVPMLAAGGQMKNTVALAWGNRLVISPHVGDLDSPKSLDQFTQAIHQLQNLYEVEAGIIVCDAHPDYRSHRHASQMVAQSGQQLIPVFHHHAHAATLPLEYNQPEHTTEQAWLVFTWDGSGYGEDGTLWGGEALLGSPGNWRRVASFKPFYLPGGDKAARQAWRSAAALCWQAGMNDFAVQGHELLKQAWDRRLNCPATTAVGRLFDAAAALTGLLEQYSFEGQGPMWLEAQVTECVDSIALPLECNEAGVLEADWTDLLPMLQDTSLSVAQRATRFHSIMAATLVEQVCRLREQYGEFCVGLTGGVFQNKHLTEHVIQLLQQQDFNVHINTQIPCNDAGLCAGQIMEAAARLNPRNL